MNIIYQNTTNKTFLPKEKIWTKSLLLESPKNKNFYPPDLKPDFLTDFGAESKIINIPPYKSFPFKNL